MKFKQIEAERAYSILTAGSMKYPEFSPVIRNFAKHIAHRFKLLGDLSTEHTIAYYSMINIPVPYFELFKGVILWT